MSKKFQINETSISMRPGTIIITNQQLPITLMEFAVKSGLVADQDFKYAGSMQEAKELVQQYGESACYVFECLGEHWGLDNKFFDEHAFGVSYQDGSYWLSKLRTFQAKIQ